MRTELVGGPFCGEYVTCAAFIGKVIAIDYMGFSHHWIVEPGLKTAVFRPPGLYA